MTDLRRSPLDDRAAGAPRTFPLPRVRGANPSTRQHWGIDMTDTHRYSVEQLQAVSVKHGEFADAWVHCGTAEGIYATAALEAFLAEVDTDPDNIAGQYRLIERREYGIGIFEFTVTTRIAIDVEQNDYAADVPEREAEAA